MHNGRHNHKVAVYHHSHAQATRLTEEQLQQTKQFRKSHVPHRNILRFFREQDVCCAVSAQKIYNVVAKIKNNRMQGRNTVEEVLYISAQRGYTVFYRNHEKSNVLSDIIIAHPTSIAMIRTWPYVLIMDTTYKTNKYIDQNVLAKLTEMVKDEEVAQRLWTSQVLHFGVETTNRTESEHSVLRLWLSTYHGDLDTVFLNINSLIEGQIAEIKYSLEISKLKEKFFEKSNAILKNISNKINHLALKKIWLEIKKARGMVEDSGKIGADIPDVHERDMDSEMRNLPSMLEEISMGPISKVPKVRRLIKGVICPVLPEDSCPPLTNLPETTVMKGQQKTNSIKRDKPHWEYMSIAHSKMGKSSGSGSRSGPSPRGRSRPPRCGRGRGRGRNSGRSSLSSVVNPDA
ncbi:hypothetical protein M9H77_07243 [Catharanthus roseus]|uniref:Uncharacterized protein n=1 Tax=Catharanthus roseus TaxID=4058 RepID=A0ACC0BUN3_CATRO|nr:hypothetical protein M9H77_07243 [Catharanthus roseus]